MKTWTARVQKTYSNLEELRTWNRIFNVAARCGYEGPDACQRMWEENPLIGGSVNPADFGRVDAETVPPTTKEPA